MRRVCTPSIVGPGMPADQIALLQVSGVASRSTSDRATLLPAIPGGAFLYGFTLAAFITSAICGTVFKTTTSIAAYNRSSAAGKTPAFFSVG